MQKNSKRIEMNKSRKTVKNQVETNFFLDFQMILLCSLYGWRFPTVSVCSGQLVKEPPPSPLPLPPPLKLGGSPVTTP